MALSLFIKILVLTPVSRKGSKLTLWQNIPGLLVAWEID